MGLLPQRSLAHLGAGDLVALEHQGDEPKIRRGTAGEHARILDFISAACRGGTNHAWLPRAPSKVTPCPPVEIVAHLVRSAFDCVTGRLEPTMAEVEAHPERWRRARGGANTRYGEIAAAIDTIATAAFILVATFSARRLGEILSLRAGALTGDSRDGFFLSVYINKNLRRVEDVPVPHVVAVAVRALERISAVARLSGDDRLFQFQPNRMSDSAKLHPESHLNEFAAAVGTPKHIGGTGEPQTWHLYSRQFRRFLAVIFFHRCRGSSVAALAHLLRHDGIERTRAYIKRDPEVARLWGAEEAAFRTDIADRIKQAGNAGGGMGRRLAQVASDARQQLGSRLQVVEPERSGSLVELTMKRGGMVLTPQPWATCTCPNTSKAASRAHCRRAGAPLAHVGPDLVQASPLVCATCPHSIVLEENLPALARSAELIERASVNLPGLVARLGREAPARARPARRHGEQARRRRVRHPADGPGSRRG